MLQTELKPKASSPATRDALGGGLKGPGRTYRTTGYLFARTPTSSMHDPLFGIDHRFFICYTKTLPCQLKQQTNVAPPVFPFQAVHLRGGELALPERCTAQSLSGVPTKGSRLLLGPPNGLSLFGAREELVIVLLGALEGS